MRFLEVLDEIYENAKEKYKIKEDNRSFSYFIPVKPVGYKPSCQFIIKKRAKSQLLFVIGAQRVHLSDFQIIETIIGMPKEDIEWFLERFIQLYKGESNKVQFKIEDKLFDGHGIEEFPQKKCLNLFSDSSVDYNDFVFLLNFIFSKDKCWEDMKKLQNFSKRTLCKYIALIDYSAYGTAHSKSFLCSINFPLDEPYPVDSREIKKLNELFKEIEKFDISLYS